MRRPLITLLLVYSIAILGLVLIPGQDAEGNIWHMGFFHAFYFVSFMATTIGFGEIPFEFTDAQRLWVSLSMYASVISWLYAIGTILTLIQDKTFQLALAENKLARNIKNIREPFYLICGYGETGSALVKGLTDINQGVVVIEIDEHRSNMIRLDNLRAFVPSLTGDAQRPIYLQEAGLENPLCHAVIAVTNDNDVNLKVAITSKLLHPNIKVICRADSHDVENNMASFGTDYIIDPFDTFATNLATAFQVPCLYLLQSWFFNDGEDSEIDEPIYPPTKKHWVICGYGRFGKAIYKRLKKEGIDVIVIEETPQNTGKPIEGVITGRGTEANTLNEANIATASGLIAGTNDDANNLSIVITARDLNPDLFVILRQNHSDNTAIINAVKADMIMHPSKIIADKIRVLLGTPMLYQFISLAYFKENSWACELASRITALLGRKGIPQFEEITLDQNTAPAVMTVINQDRNIYLRDLMHDPWDKGTELKCIALMLVRHDDKILLPGPEITLEVNDKLLFCSGSQGFTRLNWTLQHENILSMITSGLVAKKGWIWRKFQG